MKHFYAVLIPVVIVGEKNDAKIQTKKTSQKYLEGWDSIFGQKKEVAQA